MTTRLIIRLHDKNVDWTLLDAPEAIHKNCALTEIPKPEEEYTLLVIVPSSLVNIAKIKIPKTSRAKLMQAVPYALEEQIISDKPDELHFALGNFDQDGLLTVAWVKDQIIEEWLNKLKEANFKPQIIIPDSFLLPPGTRLTEEKMTLVHPLKNTPFAIDNNNRHLIKEELKELKGDYLKLINKDAATLNLLQGKYKLETKFSKLDKHWRYAAILGVIWLAVIIFGSITQLIYLKIEQHSLKQQMITLYQRIFPTATTISDPRTALEHELHLLQGSAGERSFLHLLGKTGAVIHAMPEVTLKEVIFRNKKLEITVNSKSFAILDQLAHRLTKQGLLVQRAKAVSKDKYVTETLRISA